MLELNLKPSEIAFVSTSVFVVFGVYPIVSVWAFVGIIVGAVGVGDADCALGVAGKGCDTYSTYNVSEGLTTTVSIPLAV
jgi:hypothetical protein